jgi:von Willebrand factor type A domain
VCLSFTRASFIIACVLAGCSFKPPPLGASTTGAGGTGAAPSMGTGGAAASGAGGTIVSVGSGGAGPSQGSGGDVGIGSGGGCGQTNLSVTPLPPDILIVQDRSLSMTDDSNDRACPGGTMQGNGNCGATSKWAQVIAALIPVVMQTQATVNWGLMFLGAEPTECGVATAPVVPITPGASYAPIQAALSGEQFTGLLGTPTAAVINNAVKYMQSLTDPNPKYLLLATDGEPNCAGGVLNGNDDVGANSAVAAAAAAGLPTFVVGIATSTDPAASNSLNMLAQTGGEAQTGAATKYYAVTDTNGLLSALTKILKAATPCTIPLTGVNGNLDQVAVTAKDAAGNTVQIMQDPTNGWTYTDASKTAIVLNGSACNDLQSVTYTAFQFIYTCASGHICIDNCPGADAGATP